MPDRSELMLHLTHTLAHVAPHEPLPLRLCLAFVRIVGGQDGAIVVGVTLAERTLLCATGEVAERYEDAQELVREGPGLDAFRTGLSVSSGSPEDQWRRWPQLAASMPQPPTGAVHALPIHPDSAVMGVLTVHSDADTQMGLSLAEMQFLTDAVGAAIIGELPSYDDESRLWTQRDKVSQATGMVVAQLGVGPADAVAVLRAHAFAHETSVLEVSRRVLLRDLDFSRPESDLR